MNGPLGARGRGSGRRSTCPAACRHPDSGPKCDGRSCRRADARRALRPVVR
jgi:hypothetical protein